MIPEIVASLTGLFQGTWSSEPAAQDDLLKQEVAQRCIQNKCKQVKTKLPGHVLFLLSQQTTFALLYVFKLQSLDVYLLNSPNKPL